MLNIIKADLYRLLRSKTFYIFTGIFIFTLVLQVLTGQGVSVGINSDLVDAGDEIPKKIPAALMPLFVMLSAPNLLYFCLPVIVVVASIDFSAGTVKNSVCYGVTRQAFYCSKLIIALGYALFVCVLNVALSVMLAAMINGIGSGFVFGEFMAAFFLQLLMIFAITSIGIFLAFTTKKTAATIAIYIAVLLIPALLFYILFSISDKFQFLFEYELSGMITKAARAAMLSGADLARIISMGVVLLGASIGGGIYLFNKSEIK